MKLIPETWGGKLLAVLFAIITGVAAYMPFLELFALTPAVTFIHRFNLTLEVGSLSKTLQVFLFIIPFLLYKSVREYLKRYSLKELLNEPVLKFLGALLAIDTVYSLFTINITTSLATLAVRVLLYATFFAAAVWVKILTQWTFKESFYKTAYTIARTFIIALGIFAILNSVVSVTQFLDCSIVAEKGCTVWAWVDNNFPNQMLPVGHQKFNDSLFIVRAPGFFGDVNFNGIFSLIIVTIFSSLLLTDFLAHRKKGHEEPRNKWFFLVVITMAVASYTLTLSRSAILGFVPVLFIVTGVFFFPIVRKIGEAKTAIDAGWKLLIAGVVAIAFLAGLGTQIKIPHESGGESNVTQEIFVYAQKAVHPSDDSANDHLRLFKTAIEISSKRYFLGTGLGTFSNAYQQYIDPQNFNADPHSTYGTLIAEQGVIGLGVYLVFFGFIWVKSIGFLRKAASIVGEALAKQKTLTREVYAKAMLMTFIAVLGMVLPFMTLATITYYGFFLPMTWWWGTTVLVDTKAMEGKI
ncbi:MAG: O-antigen ligase family protein [Candidatus Dojkabacteria bacterium]|nr:MAG: O-antigen ligase family protein [Candidatus Dojkabacteria bacterium]